MTLLQLTKLTVSSHHFMKHEALESLLLAFFKVKKIHEHVSDSEMLQLAKDWMDRQMQEMFLDWGQCEEIKELQERIMLLVQQLAMANSKPMPSSFDKVFGDYSETQEVYDVAVGRVIRAAMEGINVYDNGHTIFTFETPGREFLLRVSYIEIYNEVKYDLLEPTGQNLRVREDAQGTYVEGKKEEVVLSPAHALSFIAAGEDRVGEEWIISSDGINFFGTLVELAIPRYLSGRSQIIDKKSLTKKYQREISSLKLELDQFRRGILVGVNPEEIMSLKQKVLLSFYLFIIYHSWAVALIYYGKTGCLEEEEEAKAQDSEANKANSWWTLNRWDGPFSGESEEACGEIEFNSRPMKRFVEQSANDPENSKTHVKLDSALSFSSKNTHTHTRPQVRDRRKKKASMRDLEKQIVESNEASISNTSLADMQQTMMQLMKQIDEKGFELKIRPADNRILQEELQNKCEENKELQERIMLLEQQLAMANQNPMPSSEQHGSKEYIHGLRAKIKIQHIRIGFQLVAFMAISDYDESSVPTCAMSFRFLDLLDSYLLLELCIPSNKDFVLGWVVERISHCFLWVSYKDTLNRPSWNHIETVNHPKVKNGEHNNSVVKERQVLDVSQTTHDVPKEEPLVARLKARMQEIKENMLETEMQILMCVKYVESPMAALLLPCRHFSWYFLMKDHSPAGDTHGKSLASFVSHITPMAYMEKQGQMMLELGRLGGRGAAVDCLDRLRLMQKSDAKKHVSLRRMLLEAQVETYERQLVGAQGYHEAEVFQVSNDDTAVAQRRLNKKKPKENKHILLGWRPPCSQHVKPMLETRPRPSPYAAPCLTANRRTPHRRSRPAPRPPLGVASLRGLLGGGWLVYTRMYEEWGRQTFGCCMDQQQNGLVDETNVKLFSKVRCFLIQSGMSKVFWAGDTTRSTYLVNRSPSSAIRFKKPIDMLRSFGWLASIEQWMLELVLQGVEFEVEPQEDHAYEVEPQGNVDPHELFEYREVSNDAAFVVTAVDKIYAHELLTLIDTVTCEAEILATKGLLDKAKGNVLGMKTIRDHNGNTLRGDCDVEKNGKWSCIYAVGSQEYLMVCTRLDIASADVAAYMTLTEAVKEAIWLKGLIIESGFVLKIVAGIATGARFQLGLELVYFPPHLYNKVVCGPVSNVLRLDLSELDTQSLLGFSLTSTCHRQSGDRERAGDMIQAIDQ
ncbi:zinc finger, CCHC-type containing protein [Tanacetum coccineum]